MAFATGKTLSSTQSSAGKLEARVVLHIRAACFTKTRELNVSTKKRKEAGKKTQIIPTPPLLSKVVRGSCKSP